MAYIPPHKRHLKGTERPSPSPSTTPELLVPQFKRNLNLRSYRSSKVDKSGKIVYAKDAIYRWCTVGLNYDSQFPSSVHLQPISLEPVERKIGEKPLILVNSHINKEDNEVQGDISRSPWITIAENVWQDILSSFESARNEMECQQLEKVKPSLVARFGNILFHGSPSVSLETVRKCPVAESTLRQLRRTFYTNFPTSYLENIIDEVAPKIGVDFEEEKDIYHVRLSDSTRPDATIACKCSVSEDKKLKLYKVELNPVRHMVVDTSCLDKNLDMRLMLYTKRFLTALTDDEMHSIRDLVNSAVLDPDVKGGLRWPLGKASSVDQYSVIGAWHTIVTIYKSPSLKLEVEHDDRFDFRTATGEATRDITLKLTKILWELQEKVEINSIYEMLKDTLKLIWDHFFSCERLLK